MLETAYTLFFNKTRKKVCFFSIQLTLHRMQTHSAIPGTSNMRWMVLYGANLTAIYVHVTGR
jgi:hypothetical protein